MSPFKHHNNHNRNHTYNSYYDTEKTTERQRVLEEKEKIVLADFSKCKLLFPFNTATLFNKDLKPELTELQQNQANELQATASLSYALSQALKQKELNQVGEISMYDQIWLLFPREGWSVLRVEHDQQTDQKKQKIEKQRSSPYGHGRGYNETDDCLENLKDGFRRILQQGILLKQDTTHKQKHAETVDGQSDTEKSTNVGSLMPDLEVGVSAMSLNGEITKDTNQRIAYPVFIVELKELYYLIDADFIKTLMFLESISSARRTSPLFALAMAGHYARLTLGIKDVPRDVAMYLKGDTGMESEKVRDLQSKIEGYSSLIQEEEKEELSPAGRKVIKKKIEELESKLFSICSEHMFVAVDLFVDRPSNINPDHLTTEELCRSYNMLHLRHDAERFLVLCRAAQYSAVHTCQDFIDKSQVVDDEEKKTSSNVDQQNKRPKSTSIADELGIFQNIPSLYRIEGQDSHTVQLSFTLMDKESKRRVYKITSTTPDKKHRQDVVLKVRRKDLAISEATVLEELIKTYSATERPHVPKLLDVAGRFVLTECTGQPLADNMLDSPAKLFSFLHSAATAVDRFHSNGWVILDVKESNFTIPEYSSSLALIDHCWFIDAELALKFGEKIDGLPGTAFYRAPEIFDARGAGRKYVTCPSADIWSFGAMIVSLVLDATTRQLEAKFPEDQGVEYFDEQLKKSEGSWLEYLLASGGSNGGHVVSLYPHFNSARQDIASILDLVLRPSSNQRPSSKDLIGQLQILKDKYCIMSEKHDDDQHGGNVCDGSENAPLINERKEHQAEIEPTAETMPTAATISTDVKNDTVAPTTASGTKRKREAKNNDGDVFESDSKKRKET